MNSSQKQLSPRQHNDSFVVYLLSVRQCFGRNRTHTRFREAGRRRGDSVLPRARQRQRVRKLCNAKLIWPNRSPVRWPHTEFERKRSIHRIRNTLKQHNSAFEPIRLPAFVRSKCMSPSFLRKVNGRPSAERRMNNLNSISSSNMNELFEN